MLSFPAISAGKAAGALVLAVSFLVFTLLDLADALLCVIYRFIDDYLDESPRPCSCQYREETDFGRRGTNEDEVSETLYGCGRKNLFRGVVALASGKFVIGKREERRKKDAGEVPRWSACRCHSCISWIGKRDKKLHFVVMEPPHAVRSGDSWNTSSADVIFLHGFGSSSYFWTETVFPKLSKNAKLKYRLFAIDLLGFGQSPKPRDCLYRLKDHLGMIEKSLIEPFQMNSYHLVAHSMGCIIALAMAAKSPNSIKSITLVAPPYFVSSKEKASYTTLNRLAERRLWPPLLFGSAVMSWYEHLGRTVCFIACKNHRTWEWLLKVITRRRDLHFVTTDLTRHTHHSAWHSMHNVICGGARLMNDYLDMVNQSRILVTLIHGDRDPVVPLECSFNIKSKLQCAEVRTIGNADHSTVILGREKEFTRELEQIWSRVEDQQHIMRNKTAKVVKIFG